MCDNALTAKFDLTVLREFIEKECDIYVATYLPVIKKF